MAERRSYGEVCRFVGFAPSPLHERVEGVYGDEEAPVYALTFLTSLEQAAADVPLDRAARHTENLRRLLRRGPSRTAEVFAEVSQRFAG